MRPSAGDVLAGQVIEPSYLTNRGKHPSLREREPMPVTDCSGRLRELAERCRRAARKSFEVEAKGTLRATAATCLVSPTNSSEVRAREAGPGDCPTAGFIPVSGPRRGAPGRQRIEPTWLKLRAAP
jgi:hypothetical protein